jgi:hypothetical protein
LDDHDLEIQQRQKLRIEIAAQDPRRYWSAPVTPAPREEGEPFSETIEVSGGAPGEANGPDPQQVPEAASSSCNTDPDEDEADNNSMDQEVREE